MSHDIQNEEQLAAAVAKKMLELTIRGAPGSAPGALREQARGLLGMAPGTFSDSEIDAAIEAQNHVMVRGVLHVMRELGFTVVRIDPSGH